MRKELPSSHCIATASLGYTGTVLRKESPSCLFDVSYRLMQEKARSAPGNGGRNDLYTVCAFFIYPDKGGKCDLPITPALIIRHSVLFSPRVSAEVVKGQLIWNRKAPHHSHRGAGTTYPRKGGKARSIATLALHVALRWHLPRLHSMLMQGRYTTRKRRRTTRKRRRATRRSRLPEAEHSGV